MTFFSESGPDAPHKLTVSQLHLKAAQYLDHAARLHTEAAKLHAAGEPRAAELQVLMAHYLVAKVAAHVAEANKRVRHAPVQQENRWHPPTYGRDFDADTANATVSAQRQGATPSSPPA